MVSTHYGDADLTPPRGFPRQEDPDGFTVAPAVIGGDLPGAPPAPAPPPTAGHGPHARPPGPDAHGLDAHGPDAYGREVHGRGVRGREQAEEAPKRSFFGKLLRRNG
nr:hypothetical protein GCM10017745_24050 [Saccharothrix mutabilis subsp. capreolus]